MSRLAPALAGMLVVLVVADADTLITQDVATDTEAVAPPVEVAPGGSGTTTVNAAGTAADTVYSALSVAQVDVLSLTGGAGDWDIRVELVLAAGFDVLDSATVLLTDGTSTEAQVVVSLGAVTQTIGTPIEADAGGLEILVAGTKLSAGNSTLQMQVVVDLVGSSATQVRYDYSLVLT